MPRAVRNLAEAGGSSEPQGNVVFVGNLKRFATASEGTSATVGEGNVRSVSAGVVLLTGTGTYTWTLPSAAGVAGLKMLFKKTGASGVVTLDGSGAETIDGAATLAITAQNRAVEIMSDGTNWVMLSNHTPAAG
jgi:hypothetical protein